MTKFFFHLIILVSASLSAAQERPLIVGTREAPPFSMKGMDGAWEGLSIDLWRQIAEELNFEYSFRELEIHEMIAGVASGELDASVAAISITAERESQLDFSHPFYTAGLGIATRGSEGRINWLGVLSSFFSLAFLQVILLLSLVLLAAGIGVWLFERKGNPDQFGGSAPEGLAAGFWWSAVTMTTVGYGDKSPITIGGRIVALIWMFASIIIISSFTAAIASSLTILSMEPTIRGPADLVGHSVGVLHGSTSEAYLREIGISTQPFGSVREAVEAVRDGVLAAAVHDRPILRFFANQVTGVDVLVPTFHRQDYGIALPLGSELRQPLNIILLERIQSPWWAERHRRYLGE